MASQSAGRVMCAPLYIDKLSLVKPKRRKEIETVLKRNPEPQKIESIGERIRYFRCCADKLQKEVAEAVGLDRGTYAKYESGQDYYPLDKLAAIAKVLEINIVWLLDAYHRFLYEGQGERVRAAREQRGMNREELARELGVSAGTVKRWELGTERVKPEVWRTMIGDRM